MTDREESDADVTTRKRTLPGMARNRDITASSRAGGGTTGGSEDEDLGPDLRASGNLPASDDKTAEFIDNALKDLSPRWRNWVVRFCLGMTMICGFFTVIWMGPPALIIMIYAVQIKVFLEIITIGHTVYHSYNLPWFRVLSWYFLFASNYYFYGESAIDHLSIMVKPTVS